MAEDWDWADVKAALEKKGFALTRLSKQSGWHPKALSNVKNRRWHQGQTVIASALSLKPWQIWPSRYKDCRPATKRAA